MTEQKERGKKSKDEQIESGEETGGAAGISRTPHLADGEYARRGQEPETSEAGPAAAGEVGDPNIAGDVGTSADVGTSGGVAATGESRGARPPKT